MLAPESKTREQSLEGWSEGGLVSGTSLAEPAFAARALESMGTADDLLRLPPPVVHADSRQLSDLWSRSGLQAPGDDAGIAVAALSTALAPTQPLVLPSPQGGHDAPEGLETASDLLQLRPPIVHADSQRLSDLWRRSELQAPAEDSDTTVAALPTILALAQPHVPFHPQAGNVAPESLGTANEFLLQRPSVVLVDAQQLSDLWNRSELQVPADNVGIAVASLPTTSTLARPHAPSLSQAGNDAPESLDTANELLRRRSPVVLVDAQQLSDLWSRSGLQAPGDDAGTAVASLPTTLALAQPLVPSLPHAGHGAPEGLDAANDLLRLRLPAVQIDSKRLTDLWGRSGLQAPDGDFGITVASLPTSLGLPQPHVSPQPQAGHNAPLVLDVPLPAEPDPLAPVTASLPIPHEGSPPGTKSAIDLPAHASLEARDVPEGPVSAGLDLAASAAPSLAPPEFQPRMRPEGFAEHVERLKYGGRTLAELATLHPKQRPASAQQLAVSSASSAEAPVVAIDSKSPGMRPDDFDAIIAAVDTQRRAAAAARALRALHAAREAEAALVADAEPELRQGDTTNRRTSSRSTVARRATIPNAIRLEEINLVGVYGTIGDRRALVRLPSGRYVRVRVGDRVDGGRVARITESELFYLKGAQTVSLRVPRG